MLSIKLFWLAFCLFPFNRNIETLCFCLELKQPKQNVSKPTKTNRNDPKFCRKIPKYAPHHTVPVPFLFVSVQSKHRNFLVRVYGCMSCISHTIHSIWSQDPAQHCTHSGSI
jgi:hypothetical protein